MTRPLIAAALIVKDEAESLPRCLESVRPFVDEIVVYDTGSTDGTAELAESLGARVVRGYWDDDFARARNEARVAVSAEWVVQVDADERLVGDPAAMRAALFEAVEIDVFPVVVDNVQSDGTHWTFPSNRVYRRDRLHYVQPLHEQLLSTGPSIATAAEPATWLIVEHYGYLVEAVARKRGRNARIAQRALTQSKGRAARTHWSTELARARFVDGDAAAAVQLCASVADPSTPVGARALNFEVLYRLAAGDPRGCLRAVRRLRRSVRPVPNFCDLMEAEARFQLDDKPGALACLDRIEGPVVDVDGQQSPASRVPFLRACCLGITGHHAEAADAALEAAVLGPVTAVSLYVLVRTWYAAGRTAVGLVSNLSDDAIAGVVQHIGMFEPNQALPLLLELATRPEVDQTVVNAATTLAAADVELAYRAEPTLVRHGRSPLGIRARDLRLPGSMRFQSAALAYGVAKDEQLLFLMTMSADGVPTDEFPAVLLDLNDRCPHVLPQAVAAMATTDERRRAMAELLHRVGESEAAEAVLAG